MKNVLITGASGMVGGIILELCLTSDEIGTVTIINRKSIGRSHPKLKEIITSDFKNYATEIDAFQNIDAAYFCLGVYTGAVSDEVFKEITIDYAVEFAKTLLDKSPGATLCLLSGAGADRTEKSRMSFAKYKGMAENQISALGLSRFYAFRPSYIYPVEARQEPNFMYKLSRALYPVIKAMGKNSSIKSTELAQAMFKIGLHGTNNEILENKDILELLNN